MNNNQKLSLFEHLTELRQRLTKCVIAVVITSIISFIFGKQIFSILILPAKDINLIYTEMTEMIGVYMRVALAGGIILAMPYLVYQSIMFISPALTHKENRYLYIALPWMTLMFVSGVAFCYFVLLPPATKFLITFGSDIATPQIKIGNYISTVTRLLLATGLVFELPVVTTLLSRLGILKPKWLSDHRKLAFILAFILAAIITPTVDPINQSLVAVPLILLYEISIWLAKLVQKKESSVVTPVPSPVSQH